MNLMQCSKKYSGIDYNQELRTSANKTHLHGGYECCKMIIKKQG